MLLFIYPEEWWHWRCCNCYNEFKHDASAVSTGEILEVILIHALFVVSTHEIRICFPQPIKYQMDHTKMYILSMFVGLHTQYNNTQNTHEIFLSCGGSADHKSYPRLYINSRSHFRKIHNSSPTNAKPSVIPYIFFTLHSSQGNY